jgi:hypothetical protein
MEMPKPLIFINPLSPSLQKLKEVIGETNEEDGIEIYECEDLNEANQLIQTVGASITLLSHPRLCSQLLQVNRKAIKKLKSKVLLLSPKDLPRTTIQKFQKIGLTEFLCEPVAPKSLIFKVKFLIKSLPGMKIKEEEEEAPTQKVESLILDGKENKDEDNTEVKSLINEDKFDPKNQVQKKKETTLNLIDNSDSNNDSDKDSGLLLDIEKPKDSSPSNTNLMLDESENSKKSKNLDLNIEKSDDSDQSSKNLNLDIDKNDLSPQPLTNDLEPSNLQVLESEDELLLEQGKEKNSSQEDRELNIEDSPPLGLDSATDLNLDENHDINKLEKELDNFIDEDNENDHKDSFPELEESLEKKDSSKDLNIEDSDNVSSLSELDDNLVDPSQKNSSQSELDLEDSDNALNSNSSSLDLVDQNDSDNQKDENETNLQIDGSEQDVSGFEENNDNMATISDSEDLDLEKGDPNKKTSLNELDIEKTKLTSKNKDNLKITDGNESSEEKKDDLEAQSENYDSLNSSDDNLNLESAENKNATNLDIEDSDNDIQSEKELDNLVDKDDGNVSNRADFDLDIEKKEKSAATEINIDSDNKVSKTQTDLQIDGEKNEYYDNATSFDFKEREKKKKKEIEQSWEGLISKKNQSFENSDSKNKTGEESFSIDKRNLGEQTIDYGKIHKEFTDSHYEKKKKEEEEKEKDPEKKKKEQEELDKPVIPANSRGLEFIIPLLKLYEDPEVEEKQILDYLCQITQSEHNGHLIFFIYDKGKENFFEVFNSFYSHDDPDNLKEQIWLEIKKENFSKWKSQQLPTWDDPKFLEQNNNFFYPYFDGPNRLGFTIAIFNSGIEEIYSRKIEVFLESARGIFLDFSSNEVFMEKIRGDNSSTLEKAVSIVTGFFKKLFG